MSNKVSPQTRRAMTVILRRCLKTLSDAYLIPQGCHGAEAADVINEAITKAFVEGVKHGKEQK